LQFLILLFEQFLVKEADHLQIAKAEFDAIPQFRFRLTLTLARSLQSERIR